jgi:hypothetical protein
MKVEWIIYHKNNCLSIWLFIRITKKPKEWDFTDINKDIFVSIGFFLEWVHTSIIKFTFKLIDINLNQLMTNLSTFGQ